MVQSRNKTDQLTLALIAGVGALHLLALHPISWTTNEDAPNDEVEVVIEVAANRPAATTRVPETAAFAPPSRPLPKPSTREASDEVAPQPMMNLTAMPATQGTEVPSTNVTYEVGSTKNPRPPYPAAAFAARIEGRVIVKVHVMADGKPAEVQLLQTSGSAQLDRSALDTLAKWELQPARKNGEAIDQWIEIPIHFRVLQK
jgi:periplasmic protein TonB